MAQQVVPRILNDNVADEATFAVPYPEGYGQDDFAEPGLNSGHYVRSNRYGTMYDGQDAAFAFSELVITITNQAAVTIAAGTPLLVNLEIRAPDPDDDGGGGGDDFEDDVTGQQVAAKLVADLSDVEKAAFLDAMGAVDAADLDEYDEPIEVVLFEDDQDVVTGTVLRSVVIPPHLDGATLTYVALSVNDQGVTGTTDLQLIRKRSGATQNMLTAVVTLGAEYLAADGTIDPTYALVAVGDRIKFNITGAHTTKAKGANALLGFTFIAP